MLEGFGEVARQFPVVVIVIGVVWYFQRHIARQHARELSAKDAEVQRLIEDKRRLERERDHYLRLVLKLRRSGTDRGPGSAPRTS